MKYDVYQSPFGLLKIIEDEKGICEISLVQKVEEQFIQEGPFSKVAKQQLAQYFSGERKSFSISLSLKGTPFQIKVWNALCTIPYGETCSYQDIAVKVDCPKGYRAVGLANNKNPIVIVVPCHRVVGKNKSLVGYAYGLEMKQSLLSLEKNVL